MICGNIFLVKIFWNLLASTDQKIPSAAAVMTTTTHITLERERCLPLSKMYCKPCSELAAEYSNVVMATTSWFKIRFIDCFWIQYRAS